MKTILLCYPYMNRYILLSKV